MEYIEVHLDDEKLEFFTEEVETNYGKGSDIFSRFSSGVSSTFITVKNNPTSITKAKNKIKKSLLKEAQKEYEDAKRHLDFLKDILN